MTFAKLHNVVASAALAWIATFGAAQAQAADLTVDVTGIQSFAAIGSPLNVLRTFDIGAGSTVTSVSWNLNLTAFDPSWLSELTLTFRSTSSFGGLSFTPGFGDDVSGTASYSGSDDLVELGFPLTVDADGLLHLEFWEAFDDPSVDPDGIWNGTVTFGYTPGVTAPVPEPETYALMLAGLGVLGWAARRRKVN